MTSGKEIKKLIDEMDNKLGPVKLTKRQVTPLYIKEHIAMLAESNSKTERSLFENIKDEIDKHTVSSSLDLLKFSLLTVYWPEKSKVSSLGIYQAIKQRNLATDTLINDGVALSFIYNKEHPKNVKLVAEDMKGRMHPLSNIVLTNPMASASVNSGKVSRELHLLTLSKISRVSSRYPNFVSNELKSMFNRITIIDVPSNEMSKLKDIWEISKDGIVSTYPSIDKTLPIPFGFSSPEINNQLKKINPSFIPLIANSVRLGPTQKTLVKMFEPIFTKKDFVSINELLKKINETIKNSSLNDEFKVQLENKQLPVFLLENYFNDVIKARILTDIIISSGKFFNPKPKSKPLHQSISVEKENHPKKEHYKKEDAKEDNSVFNEMLKISLQEQNLLSLDVASSMVKCMHPDGVSLSPDDVASLCSIVDTIKRHPNVAEHGVAMFSGIIEGKGRSIKLNQTYDSHKSTLTPSTRRPT